MKVTMKKIICRFNTFPPNRSGQWSDLKTVNGYLRRLQGLCGLTGFEIWSEIDGQIVKYLAICPDRQNQPTGPEYNPKEWYYYDYRVNEYRNICEHVNMDLCRSYHLTLWEGEYRLLID